MIRIKEAIVVEGRDDTTAVQRACEALIIETHGFGIRKETWDVLEKAYEEKGLIIFTDPDYSGEEIRRRLTARFPDARQAFLTRDDATKKGDIGIENATPEAIEEALRKVHFIEETGDAEFSERDMFEAGLSGRSDSKQRRELLAAKLGIGYGNCKAMLKKLNNFGISREDFNEALSTIDN